MIETPERTKLVTIKCALCGMPVAQMSRVNDVMAGGMCTRDTCVRDQRTGKPRQVYTFHRLVNEL